MSKGENKRRIFAMTNEEAIDILNGAEVMVLNRDFDEFNKAIMLAILALHPESKKEGGANE